MRATKTEVRRANAISMALQIPRAFVMCDEVLADARKIECFLRTGREPFDDPKKRAALLRRKK